MKTPAVVLLLVALILTTLSASSSPRDEQLAADLAHKAYVPGVGSDAHRDVPPAPTIYVTSQGDAGRAVTVLITAEDGGVVEGTGADGSQFKLTIGPGALLFDEFVTMTPIVSMAGLPTGVALSAGVLLEPDGLQLAIPAILDVDPGEGASGSTLGVFHKGSSGQLIPAPVVIKSGPASLLVTHFSGWGAAEGSAESLSEIAQQQFPEGMSWTAQAAAATNEAAETLHQGGSSQDGHMLAWDALRAEWPIVFRPALVSAQTAASEGQRPFPSAFYTISNAIRGVRLLSPTPPFGVFQPADIGTIVNEAEQMGRLAAVTYMETSLARCNAAPTPLNIIEVKDLAREITLLFGGQLLSGFDFSECRGTHWVGTTTFYDEFRDSLGSLVTISATAELEFEEGFLGGLDASGQSTVTFDYSYHSVTIDGLVCDYSASGTLYVKPLSQTATWPIGRLTVLPPEQGSPSPLWRYMVDTGFQGSIATATMTCSSGYTGQVNVWPSQWVAFDGCGTNNDTFRKFDPDLGRIRGAFQATASTSPLHWCRSTWDFRFE